MENVAAIILAAGKGTRMKSDLVKVLHPLAGRPMIEWPLGAARAAGAAPLVAVVGHQGDAVRQQLGGRDDVLCALQAEQLGTGHAVACATGSLAGFSGTVLILCGDTPLLRGETLMELLNFHRSNCATLTVLTARMADPFGYGRIVRGADGGVKRIVEQKDATPDELAINEINSGIYCMEADFLFSFINSLRSDNAQKEYYLTDLVGIAGEKGATCMALAIEESDEIMGVNDRAQLAEAARILRGRINHELMLSGVTLIDPAQSYIDAGVTIGPDTVVHPNCVITGATEIGSRCVIESGVSIWECRIGNGCHLKSGSVLEKSQLLDSVAVGPMAHLRPGTLLKDKVKIGNFVETKKIVMGEGSKASHLTYLGDAEIGRDVNIGCGTITCNYDGVNKHLTVIEDNVFVGSDVQLVAPVKVGANALIAAGTTVTREVPTGALAISRVPQVNKERWRRPKKIE